MQEYLFMYSIQVACLTFAVLTGAPSTLFLGIKTNV